MKKRFGFAILTVAIAGIVIASCVIAACGTQYGANNGDTVVHAATVEENQAFMNGLYDRIAALPNPNSISGTISDEAVLAEMQAFLMRFTLDWATQTDIETTSLHHLPTLTNCMLWQESVALCNVVFFIKTQAAMRHKEKVGAGIFAKNSQRTAPCIKRS